MFSVISTTTFTKRTPEGIHGASTMCIKIYPQELPPGPTVTLNDTFACAFIMALNIWKIDSRAFFVLNKRIDKNKLYLSEQIASLQHMDSALTHKILDNSCLSHMMANNSEGNIEWGTPRYYRHPSQHHSRQGKLLNANTNGHSSRHNTAHLYY